MRLTIGINVPGMNIPRSILLIAALVVCGHCCAANRETEALPIPISLHCELVKEGKRTWLKIEVTNKAKHPIDIKDLAKSARWEVSLCKSRGLSTSFERLTGAPPPLWQEGEDTSDAATLRTIDDTISSSTLLHLEPDQPVSFLFDLDKVVNELSLANRLTRLRKNEELLFKPIFEKTLYPSPAFAKRTRIELYDAILQPQPLWYRNKAWELAPK